MAFFLLVLPNNALAAGGKRATFEAVAERGELRDAMDVGHLVDLAVSVPYFSKLISGMTIDEDWLESHVDLICELAVGRVNV